LHNECKSYLYRVDVVIFRGFSDREDIIYAEVADGEEFLSRDSENDEMSGLAVSERPLEPYFYFAANMGSRCRGNPMWLPLQTIATS
jgi:hypothetical protein